jgi:Zn-dependent oligopeptidase
VVGDVTLLKGLSDAEIAKAKSAAEARGLKDKWLLSLRISVLEFLSLRYLSTISKKSKAQATNRGFAALEF